MALKDPKVSLFAFMNCCGLLGSGFASFFPTYAYRSDYHSSPRCY